jgi:hypothetical protein
VVPGGVDSELDNVGTATPSLVMTFLETPNRRAILISAQTISPSLPHGWS